MWQEVKNRKGADVPYMVIFVSLVGTGSEWKNWEKVTIIFAYKFSSTPFHQFCWRVFVPPFFVEISAPGFRSSL
jgi:hypothetical protein